MDLLTLGQRLQVCGRHFLGGGHIDDTDRAALMGDLLNEPPSLAGVSPNFMCVRRQLIQIRSDAQDIQGIVANG